MFDRGFVITLQSIRRQLAAMPHEVYLIRLIHHTTRRSVPGERLWTATQLGHAATVRFLRMRNREGCDIYIQPYAENRNAGYILVDLDRTNPAVIESMRANGHDPCVVLQTSPGHLQAWIHLSTSPLEPAVATAAGKQLARAYGGDLASTDWRHLGRLAGFTNQKPERRTPGGYAPWVKIVHAHPGLARNADGLLQSAIQLPALTQGTSPGKRSGCAGRLQNAGHRSPPPRPPRSIKAGCSDGGLRNAFHSRTGASWISGSPGSCCRRVHPQSGSRPFSNSPAHTFPAATLTPTTTCDARSRVLLFPPPRALCVLMPQPPTGLPSRAPVRTPPADDSPAPSAIAAGCRPCSEMAQSKLAPRPDHGTPAGRPPRTSASS